jgi:hypothetical protein
LGEETAKKEKKSSGHGHVKSEPGQKRKLADGPKSLQDDPNIPKAVKAMFTTSAAAKAQPQAHWVTHNPLYF